MSLSNEEAKEIAKILLNSTLRQMGATDKKDQTAVLGIAFVQSIPPLYPNLSTDPHPHHAMNGVIAFLSRILRVEV